MSPSPLAQVHTSSSRSPSRSRSRSGSSSRSTSTSSTKEGPFDWDLDFGPQDRPSRKHLYPTRRWQGAAPKDLPRDFQGDFPMTEEESAKAIQEIQQYRHIFEQQQVVLQAERCRLEGTEAAADGTEVTKKDKGKGKAVAAEILDSADEDLEKPRLPPRTLHWFKFMNWPLDDGHKVRLSWTRLEMDRELLELEHERQRRGAKISHWRALEDGCRAEWKKEREQDQIVRGLEKLGINADNSKGVEQDEAVVCPKHGYPHFIWPKEVLAALDFQDHGAKADGDEDEEPDCILHRLVKDGLSSGELQGCLESLVLQKEHEEGKKTERGRKAETEEVEEEE